MAIANMTDKEWILILFCKGLHCDSLLQGITLSSLSTGDYIVIAFYKGLHRDPFIKMLTLRFPSTEDYIVIPNRTNNEYIVIPFC